MPRYVDSDGRRRHITNAVWRVIRRDGLERASVRVVATEAGLSMGSLRHYFATQSELYTFAMCTVIDGITSRVEALELPTDPRQAAEQVLAEFLPLDAQRSEESQVWLAFTARSLVDPTLRVLRDDAYDRLHHVCRRLVLALMTTSREAGSDDVALETERLYALIDGLLIHGVIRPTRADGELLRRVVGHHLDRLCDETDSRSR